MISKKELLYFTSLLSKKYRNSENKFIVEGIKTVLEGLNSQQKCELIFVTNKLLEKNEKIKNKLKGQRIEILKNSDFKKISNTNTPQGIAAVFSKPDIEFRTEFLGNEQLVIFLSNISDPGNLGTIIRNCDWFGVKNVLLSSNTVDYTNPKVIRSSMGSIFHLNVYENIIVDQVEDLKNSGFEILCADISGENVFNYKNEKKKVLILSSESHGPSEELKNISHAFITVPKLGLAESLNVASASAVLLAQLTK